MHFQFPDKNDFIMTLSSSDRLFVLFLHKLKNAEFVGVVYLVLDDLLKSNV